MRATLAMGRAATGATLVAGQKHVQDAQDIIRYLILYTYIAGIILPLPLGWLGDALANLAYATTTISNHWYNLYLPAVWNYTAVHIGALTGGFRYLGYIPSGIAFLSVSAFYWDFEARMLSAEVLVQGLPESIRTRIAKWSMKEGFTYKFFYGNSMVGLWMPVLLFIPTELPVWRHPVHYLGVLCVVMSITQFVATMKKADPYWRKFLGFWVGAFGVRHILGFMGYEVQDLWAPISRYTNAIDTSDPESMFQALLVIAAIGGFASWWNNRKLTSTTATH